MNAYELAFCVRALPSPCVDCPSRRAPGHDHFGQLLGHASCQDDLLFLHFMRHLKHFVFPRTPVSYTCLLSIAILEFSCIRSAEEISDAVSVALSVDSYDSVQRTPESLFIQETQCVGHVDYGVSGTRFHPLPLS